MKTGRLRMLVGLAMVAVGAVQAAIFALRGEWLPTGLGVFYSVLGVAYLWAEVYRAE